jgi:hypothetical protein
MKKMLLIIVLLTAAITFAQSTVTYSDVANIFASGKAWISISNDYPAVPMDVGTASSSAQNWTVPNIAWKDTFLAVNTPPASTPYASEFPTATHAQETKGSLYGYTGTLYSYYRLENNALYSLGTAAHVQIGPIDTTMISKSESFLFPLPVTYGSTKELSSDTMDVGGGLVYITSSTQTVDAFGNITFPFGTYPSLRVSEITQTSVYNNGSLAYQETQPSFTWIAKDAGTFLADIDTTYGYSGTVYLTSAELTQYTTAPLAVDERGLNAPNKFVLYQNYPNPFNPSTKIRYTIPANVSEGSNSLVTLKVYNILGSEVATLVNEDKPAGSYEIEFSAANVNGAELPSGVYFYRLTAGGLVQTQKMILLK